MHHTSPQPQSYIPLAINQFPLPETGSMVSKIPTCTICVLLIVSCSSMWKWDKNEVTAIIIITPCTMHAKGIKTHLSCPHLPWLVLCLLISEAWAVTPIDIPASDKLGEFSGDVIEKSNAAGLPCIQLWTASVYLEWSWSGVRLLPWHPSVPSNKIQQKHFSMCYDLLKGNIVSHLKRQSQATIWEQHGTDFA